MKHNDALDGIRALAVAMVLGFHAFAPGAAGGYLGVDIFFVLSGFLITSLLLEELRRSDAIDLGRFYLRRLLRLTPPLLLMLAAYLVLAPIAWPQMAFHTDVRDVLISTFYLSDYASAFWALPQYLRHTWSLAVEWHFYLLWPLVLLLLARRMRSKHLAMCLGALYLVFTAWRVYCDLNGDAGYTHAYYRFDTRLSGLTAGSLLALLLTQWRPRFRFRHTELAGIVALIVIALCTWKFHVQSNAAMFFGITMVEMAAVALVFLCLSPESKIVRPLFAHPLASYIGRMSYGIYLWHYPIFVYLWGRAPWYVILFGGGLVSLGLAMVSYHTVERVARHHSRKLRAATPAAEAVAAQRAG